MSRFLEDCNVSTFLSPGNSQQCFSVALLPAKSQPIRLFCCSRGLCAKVWLVFFSREKLCRPRRKKGGNKLCCLLLHCTKRCYVPDIIVQQWSLLQFLIKYGWMPIMRNDRDKEKRFIWLFFLVRTLVIFFYYSGTFWPVVTQPS